MSARPLRQGVSPADRPTEWATALVMLITAGVAWLNNKDTAALIAVGAACLPVLVTAITSWREKNHIAGETPEPVVE